MSPTAKEQKSYEDLEKALQRTISRYFVAILGAIIGLGGTLIVGVYKIGVHTENIDLRMSWAEKTIGDHSASIRFLEACNITNTGKIDNLEKKQENKDHAFIVPKPPAMDAVALGAQTFMK